jgi:hypothetical protein
MNIKELLERCEGFEWDEGNREKNQSKHGVSTSEAEEVFFDPHNQTYPDPTHSRSESRHILIGKTKNDRLLFIVYVVRNRRIRIISARDLNKRKEAKLYEEAA